MRIKDCKVKLSSKNQELWDKFSMHLNNIAVTQKRKDKVWTMYQVIVRGLGDLDKITRTDVEAFVNKLHTNKFKRLDNVPYSGSTKSDIKKFLRTFFKWHKGEDEYFPSEVRWIRTRIAKDERPDKKEIVNLPEVKKLANAFQNMEHKIMTLILFDSGFRINELLTMKCKHLTWEPYEDKKKCFWVECIESKTETRKIPIPLFTEDIQSYINSINFNGKDSKEPLFSSSYSSYSMNLRNISKKIIGRILSPHSLRHSSATYYGPKINNIFVLNKRLGWTIGSTQGEIYVHPSGIDQNEAVKPIYTNEVVKLRGENEELLERVTKLENELKKAKLEPEMLEALEALRKLGPQLKLALNKEYTQDDME
jgi:integrase